MQCLGAECLMEEMPHNILNSTIISVAAGSKVRYGENISFTCIVPGKGNFTRHRKCSYYQKRYQLIGGSYECGCESALLLSCIQCLLLLLYLYAEILHPSFNECLRDVMSCWVGHLQMSYQDVVFLST